MADTRVAPAAACVRALDGREPRFPILLATPPRLLSARSDGYRSPSN